ncbi:defensin beta 4B [Phyllostomus discolor]|uniref:Defensin beta 4B n=1 Tax=Phyllostomus discolor TaxID=89673 RepID=A0A833Z0B8_9CHIR|nr:defensin beta 4B [Phyllostomus discolor]
MRIHHLLLAFFFVFLLSVPGFSQISYPGRCRARGGACWRSRCPGNRREVSNCALPGFKCCVRK